MNIKPCPFCGGTGELRDGGNDEPEMGGPFEFWLCGCDKCDVWRCDLNGDKEVAVKLWNTRVQDKPSHDT